MSLKTASSIQQLTYIHNQLTYYLNSVENYSKSIIVDSRIQNYVKKFNVEQAHFNARDKIALKSEITRIIQTTPFIHSVTLYGNDLSRVVTTEIYPYPIGIENLTNLTTAQWISRTKHANTSNVSVIPVLSLIRPFYNIFSGTLLGYIEICIPENIFCSVYKNDIPNLNKIFITNQQGVVESSDGSITIGDNYPEFSKIAKFNAKKQYSLSKNNIVFVKPFDKLDWYIINEINLYYFLLPILEVLMLFIIIGGICIITCLILAHKASKHITDPLLKLILHTKQIKAGNWNPVNIPCDDPDITLLFDAFNTMLIAQEDLKNNLLESQRTKDKMFLDLLQQQVNPHFLYNTLDNICALAELDEKKALTHIVMNLSTFYRKVLSNGKFYISIREELELTRAYLHIMQIRYVNKFQFFIQYDDTLLDYGCLKLLLQPIVENSIYHGIKELDRKGVLVISVKKDTTNDDTIVFEVRDNGIGMSKEVCAQIWTAEGQHFALRNINQRIQLYYGDSYGISMSTAPNKGCVTIIKIKKQGVLNDGL
ncbi:MAG: sensor histidine kinase [Cellulosilyticaceae bacterium]